MILVDTSVWVDHLRSVDPQLSRLLDDNLVLSHPWVLGELLLGGLDPDSPAGRLIPLLPNATVATDTEMLTLIRREHLAGSGIGYVDTQLLAATRLTAGTRLWSRDRRLDRAADSLGIAYRARL